MPSSRSAVGMFTVACDVFILVYLMGEDADDKLRLPNRAQTPNDRETRRNAKAAGRLTTFFGLLGRYKP